ncbi:MAG: hypothetical protein QXL85_07010 [Candidatus Bathyarchaeia archaeon]
MGSKRKLKSNPRRQPLGFKSPFKFGNNEFDIKSEIYDYNERLERYRRIIAKFGRNGEIALRFLDHLASLGLPPPKFAATLIALLLIIDFNLEDATRRDVERVVAWINKQPYKD